MTPIDSIVARLTSLHPKLIDLSLDRMRRILGSLGHPEQQLPPTIHVAGTNGKGSTIAFMRAILEAAGLRVHVYTSPHLVRFNERFRLGGKGEGRLASDEELSSALNECERANAGAPITVFEITTAVPIWVRISPNSRAAPHSKPRAKCPRRRSACRSRLRRLRE